MCGEHGETRGCAPGTARGSRGSLPAGEPAGWAQAAVLHHGAGLCLGPPAGRRRKPEAGQARAEKGAPVGAVAPRRRGEGRLVTAAQAAAARLPPEPGQALGLCGAPQVSALCSAHWPVV